MKKLTGKYFKCEVCGKDGYKRPSIFKRSDKHFCSKKCSSRYKGDMQKGKPAWNKGLKGVQKAWNKGVEMFSQRGKNHPGWKGGVVLSGNGYIRVRKDLQYKLQHRIVMEDYLERKLNNGEVVHHIDGDRANNDINNLMLFPTNAAHIKYHKTHK